MTDGPGRHEDVAKHEKSPRQPQAFGAGFVGAVIEAWSELRIHKTRVMLSLIGVAVAVAALTSVVGLGAIAEQATRESAERSSGRPATLYLSAYSSDGSPLDRVDFTEAFETAVDRYSISYASAMIYTTQRVQFIDGVVDVETQLVDVDYGTMHRVLLDEGRWFVEQDAERLAPAIIVNDVFYERLGSPDLASHPTVTLFAGSEVTAVIVGVTPVPAFFTDYPPQMFMLPESYFEIADPAVASFLQPQFELWVPPDIFEPLMGLLQRDVAGALGKGVTVDVFRSDFAANGEDPLAPIRAIVGGVSILVLFLGALGLVNISLVTVRQRIREIGIRRSFGATAGRVFFAVMMESVVATVIAGVIGVMLAVAIVENETVQQYVAQGVGELPPFPIEAALLGLAAAAGVGALAGLLPAIVAVRVKVIDAIRY